MPDAFGHCEQLVRAADKDRYLAALFAPAQRRGGLFALYAFNVEVARVRELVHNPPAGEIRPDRRCEEPNSRLSPAGPFWFHQYISGANRNALL